MATPLLPETTAAVMDVSEMGRGQLEDLAVVQQQKIQAVQQQNAELEKSKPLPLPVHAGVSTAAAYGASRADRAAGADGKLEVLVAVTATGTAVLTQKTAPTISKLAASTGIGVLNGMAAKAGDKHGMRDAAEAEARRQAAKAQS